MKTKLLLFFPILLLFGFMGIIASKKQYPETKRVLAREDGCVFMTVMGEQSSDDYSVFKNNENLKLSVNDGLSWLTGAQLKNGGYGAGSHAHQEIIDPHAVPADPATTAMVGMAFLRSGNSLNKGKYSENLQKLLRYLLETVENTSKDNPYITDVRGTQIQSKLGQNIDAVLTAQFFSNMLHQKLNSEEKKRIERALDICVSKIEAATDAEGKQQGAGWAGVLQSGLASTALESASAMGANVDKKVLDKTRDYQKGNYDENTNEVKADDGAGVMLYAVSGSVRATAKDARSGRANH